MLELVAIIVIAILAVLGAVTSKVSYGHALLILAVLVVAFQGVG